MVDIADKRAYMLTMILDDDTAAALLSQLGNPTRLKIIRALVRAGNSGLPVGEIQRLLDIPNSTLSHHLSHLRRVGLIDQQRESTVLRCRVEFGMIDRIVAFLTHECCIAESEYQTVAGSEGSAVEEVG